MRHSARPSVGERRYRAKPWRKVDADTGDSVTHALQSAGPVEMFAIFGLRSVQPPDADPPTPDGNAP